MTTLASAGSGAGAGPDMASDGLETLLAQSQLLAEAEGRCTACGSAGKTALVGVDIAAFGQATLVWTRCGHCGAEEVAPCGGGAGEARRAVYSVRLTRARDLGRFVLKSEQATVTVPELALEIPARRAQATTIGRILADTVQDLQLDQAARQQLAPGVHAAIEVLCGRIAAVLAAAAAGGEMPVALSLVLEDPTGQSIVEFVPGEAKGDMRKGPEDAGLGVAPGEEARAADAQMEGGDGRRVGSKAKAADDLAAGGDKRRRYEWAG